MQRSASGTLLGFQANAQNDQKSKPAVPAIRASMLAEVAASAAVGGRGRNMSEAEQMVSDALTADELDFVSAMSRGPAAAAAAAAAPVFVEALRGNPSTPAAASAGSPSREMVEVRSDFGTLGELAEAVASRFGLEVRGGEHAKLNVWDEEFEEWCSPAELKEVLPGGEHAPKNGPCIVRVEVKKGVMPKSHSIRSMGRALEAKALAGVDRREALQRKDDGASRPRTLTGLAPAAENEDEDEDEAGGGGVFVMRKKLGDCGPAASVISTTSSYGVSSFRDVGGDFGLGEEVGSSDEEEEEEEGEEVQFHDGSTASQRMHRRGSLSFVGRDGANGAEEEEEREGLDSPTHAHGLPGPASLARSARFDRSAPQMLLLALARSSNALARSSNALADVAPRASTAWTLQ